MSDFDFTDFCPESVTYKSATVSTNLQGVDINTWAIAIANKYASLQPLSARKIQMFATLQINVDFVAYHNERLTVLNGYRMTDSSGNNYDVQSFQLQGGGGAQGDDIVFAVYLKRIYS